MTASERRRGGDSSEFRAGEGVPIPGDDEVEVLLAPRLRRRIRRLVRAMSDLAPHERGELTRLVEEAILASFRASKRSAGEPERARLDELLRKAGLPPTE